MNVKQLQRVLDQIDNKLLEVEVVLAGSESLSPEIEFVRMTMKKVLIFLKRDVTK